MTLPPDLPHAQASDSDWQSIIDAVIARIGQEPSSNPPNERLSGGLAKYIDHTLLKPEATTVQVTKLCEEAKNYKFKTVCVRVEHVEHARQTLKDSGVGICCVIGFPEGTYSTEDKCSEAKTALERGATELDAVLNYYALISRRYSHVFAELAALRATAPRPSPEQGPPTTLKLILETSQLSKSNVVAAVVLAFHADFDFVKTSTGFLGRGATPEDVRLMRQTIALLEAETPRDAGGMQVKASGGIRTLGDARRMLEAGATRLGVSAGVAIVDEASKGAAQSSSANTTGY